VVGSQFDFQVLSRADICSPRRSEARIAVLRRRLESFDKALKVFNFIGKTEPRVSQSLKAKLQK
jgi:hypothetical protein